MADTAIITQSNDERASGDLLEVVNALYPDNEPRLALETYSVSRPVQYIQPGQVGVWQRGPRKDAERASAVEVLATHNTHDHVLVAVHDQDGWRMYTRWVRPSHLWFKEEERR